MDEECVWGDKSRLELNYLTDLTSVFSDMKCTDPLAG